MLTDGVFCPVPWTGLMYNFDGTVKNCIRSDNHIAVLGNIKDNTIEDILLGSENLKAQQTILKSEQYSPCHTCYDLERGKKGFDIISDRIFYLKELKQEPIDTYTYNNFNLKVIDVRWTNQCNFACVYCGPRYSSKWTKELKIVHDVPTDQQLHDFKQYIFKHAQQLTQVYLAGGEPLLMKQNLELLEVLKRDNPNVHLRVNTNLSNTGTQVFERICEFENVHWTVSGETMNEQFNYIRHGGKWEDWLTNLDIITQLDHKISFNMLYYMLNYNSLFDTVDYLLDRGFHPNSFIIGPLLNPEYLDVRHLPSFVIQNIKENLQQRINQKPGYLLEDSYLNLLHYIQQPFDADLPNALEQIRTMDERRGINSKTIFPEVYSLL